MKTVDLIQGSAEWHAHRAQHFNASDAPAMMGCSPYESRGELIRRLATGITAEIDAGTQRRFDDGHRFEALCRPLAEEILGDDLYPVTGTEGKLSASFDGLPMDESVNFEHKTLNDALRAVLPAEGVGTQEVGATLPLMYRVQMEHQMLVAGCGESLFSASRWADDDTLIEARHCWYAADEELAASIRAGWDQLERDVAAYVPPAAAAPAAVGKAPQTLPALRVDVTGMVTASNLEQFKAVALEAIRSVNRELTTDQHFADAAESVKWCAEVESRLKAAKEHILGQTGSIDAALKLMDDISEEARRTRLDLDKLVTNRKDAIKAEIITKARAAFLDHVAELAAEIKGAPLQSTVPNFAEATKNKRTVATMQDAVDTMLAQAKIETSRAAKILRDGLACIAEAGAGFEFLFADKGTLAGKPVDDLKVIVQARIDKHKEAEAAREAALVAEVERKAREKLAAEQREEAERQAAAQATAVIAQAAAPAPVAAPSPVAAPAVAHHVGRFVASRPGAQAQPAPEATATAVAEAERPPLAELLAHIALAFDCKFPSHPKPSLAWWAELRTMADAVTAAQASGATA